MANIFTKTNTCKSDDCELDHCSLCRCHVAGPVWGVTLCSSCVDAEQEGTLTPAEKERLEKLFQPRD